MTAQEIKEIALNASKDQYEKVIAELKKIAEAGGFSYTVSNLTDGTIELLRVDGFIVSPHLNRINKPTNSYEISIKKTE